MLDQLFGLLACADESVRFAIYETDWDCIVDAFLAKLAGDADLVVQLVIDDDQCPRGTGGTLTCPLSRLETSPRVLIADDSRSDLMHHKFAIFDDAQLWVGSANMTQWSFCTDNNNAIVVDEPAIVAAYGNVFRRMFVDGTFGPVAPEAPVVGGIYKVYFSPESPASSASRWFNDLVAAVGSATTSAEIMINAWTREEISTALIAAHGRGVTVRAVVQNMYIDEAPAQALLAAGIPLHTGEIHSKVMILDNRTVIAGSANWSAAAWSNNENSLWITDSTVAAAYHAEFERIFAATSPPAP
jgi:phosphatidylserine/phosphatidylglycerophosphate/cardiolipin synthase-like enzyme